MAGLECVWSGLAERPDGKLSHYECLRVLLRMMGDWC
jgi:hypothetical protein